MGLLFHWFVVLLPSLLLGSLLCRIRGFSSCLFIVLMTRILVVSLAYCLVALVVCCVVFSLSSQLLGLVPRWLVSLSAWCRVGLWMGWLCGLLCCSFFGMLAYRFVGVLAYQRAVLLVC